MLSSSNLSLAGTGTKVGVYNRSAKKAKQSKKVKNPSIPEEGHVGGSFGFRLFKGGISKIFVPKGAKKCMVTSVDPKLVVFDPP